MNKTSYTNLAKAWEFAEQHAVTRESRFVAEARQQAEEAELPQESSAQAQLLRTIAVMVRASSIIAIGTASIGETLELAEGLEGAGQLTAVDSSSRGITLIRQLFHTLADRTQTTLRAVNAPVGAFLPRLNADDYDLITVSGDCDNYAATLREAPRLLRANGVIAFTDVLAFASAEGDGGGVLNPADRSAKTLAMRDLLDAVESDERFYTTLTPVGTGLLIAVRR